MWSASNLALRWTIGDVSEHGFEALRLSVWGAWRVFGAEASYDILVNSVPLARAREWVGPLPRGVRWHNVTRAVPKSLKPYLDGGMAEGVGWKFAPLRLHPDKFELSLDNDCILWDWPEAVRAWLDGAGDCCLIAEDVRTMLGQFESLCGPEPRNSGIRGTPPGFDFEHSLLSVLQQCPVKIQSELDEQGLVTAALSIEQPPLVVTVDEVSICSPFPPHVPWLGRCGAHFVGLNARNLPWDLDGRPASDYIREHWRRHRKALYDRVEPGK